MRIIGFKYRIKPTKGQEKLLMDHISHNRFVYNKLVDYSWIQYLNGIKNQNLVTLGRYLQQLKQEHEFLYKIDSNSSQQVIRHFLSGIKNMFKGISGKPKHKKKGIDDRSFRAPMRINIKLNFNDKFNSSIKLPKFNKPIKLIYHRNIPDGSRIVSYTVSRKRNGEWYISFQCEVPDSYFKKSKGKNIVGIDLGIKTYATLSDGTIIKNPKYMESAINKLRKLHKKYSKYKKKDKLNPKLNEYKINRHLRKLQNQYVKVHNQIMDFIHKMSTKLINDSQVICLETLGVKDMLERKGVDSRLKRQIQYVNWGACLNILKYKADWYGVEIRLVPKNFPSSKLCSNCHNKDDTVTLRDRTYECKKCGHSMDRDLNAAINILNNAK